MILLLGLTACSRDPSTSPSAAPGGHETQEGGPGLSSNPEELTPAGVRAALGHVTKASMPDPSQVSETITGGESMLGICEWSLSISRRPGGENVKALLYGNHPPRDRSVLIVAGHGPLGSLLMMKLHQEAVTTLFIEASPGWNLDESVQNVLTGIAYLRGGNDVQSIDLVGLGDGGPIVLLARGLCGNAVRRTYAQYAGLAVRDVLSAADWQRLPDVLQTADFGRLAIAIAPGELFLANTKGLEPQFLKKAYAGFGSLRIEEGLVSSQDIAGWLLR